MAVFQPYLRIYFFTGNDATLPCKFVGNPRPNVIWLDPNSKVIESSEKYSMSQEGELRIRSMEWSDMGAYVCALENSVGEDSVETFLYPMQVIITKIITTTDIYLILGSRIRSG